jgi:hypothetical protein
MKKIFATFMIMATMAIMLPIAASAQTYSTRRVYRNGRWQTVRVVTTVNRGNHYGWRNRNRRISPQEQMRLARQRNRIYRQRDRITRDGVVTSREARRYNRSTNKYVRTVRRVRNN